VVSPLVRPDRRGCHTYLRQMANLMPFPWGSPARQGSPSRRGLSLGLVVAPGRGRGQARSDWSTATQPISTNAPERASSVTHGRPCPIGILRNLDSDYEKGSCSFWRIPSLPVAVGATEPGPGERASSHWELYTSGKPLRPGPAERGEGDAASLLITAIARRVFRRPGTALEGRSVT
jgi:hypothetical protein